MKPITTQATYTGGGIWLFTGTTDEDNYYLADDYGCVLILNKNPDEYWDECLFSEWQQKYLVKELKGKQRLSFGKQILNFLRQTDNSSIRDGMFDTDIDNYERCWEKLL